MNVVGAAHQFEGSKESNDRNGITLVEEVRLFFQFNVLHNPVYVA